MQSVLKRYFGYSQFRPYQKEIIEEILNKKDCLVVMATGSGKSLWKSFTSETSRLLQISPSENKMQKLVKNDAVWQIGGKLVALDPCHLKFKIPALVTRKTAVIISPLLSLMQDQVMCLKEHGIKAEYLGTTQADKDAQTNAENGTFNVLYMTPEKACSLHPRFWTNLLNNGICLLAVDEAHCISEWGHDFRKEYKKLHTLREFLLGVPFVALTATATKKVRDDIVCSLDLFKPSIVVGSFDRKNLFYGVKPFSRSQPFMDELVRQVSKYNSASSSTIIYCSTVKDTEQVHKSLLNAGIVAGIYHGKMGGKDREASHRSFIRDEVNILVATIAFGMGIDKPNIRCVIHYGCPKSLETYYQESGRCGRDGLASICWLYYSRSDFGKADFYCSEAESENQRKAIVESCMAVEKYCLLATCRRKYILQYFGEMDANECGNCDNCTRDAKERNVARESFLLLSCIKSCGGKWGINMPIDILRGSHAKRILDNNYDKLPLHGLGKEYSSNWWKVLAAQLIALGYLKEHVEDVYRTVSVAQKGMKFIQNTNSAHQDSLVIALTSEMVDEEEHGCPSKIGDIPNISSTEFKGFSEDEIRLFHALLDTRTELAKENGTAPYAICGDQTIIRLTKLRPSSKARLANIDGINQHFVTRYGERFLLCITQVSKEANFAMDSDATELVAIMKNDNMKLKRKLAPRSQGKLTPAKYDAWKLWQHDGRSFHEIANFPGKPGGPIKEQTVISYILDAAQEGYEINWSRFCNDIGLTLDITRQIQHAITKVGSIERLKPIKEELPDTTHLMMETLSVSAEEILGNNYAGGVSCGTAKSQFTDDECVKEDLASDKSASHSPKFPMAPTPSPGESYMKRERSGSPSDLESHAKLQKIGDDGKCNDQPVASDSAILEWIEHQDGVSGSDIIEHFSGSNMNSVMDLLAKLEGEFLIFKKNDLYRAL